MPHSLWSGSISFGLVSVPVSLYPATEDHTVHFHQFEAGTSDRIHYAQTNERTGDEVPFDRIVKGYDLGGGESVLVTSEELGEVAPARSETIEIANFVDLVDIDPIHFRSTYYLAPKGKGAAKPYKLLMAAMQERGKAGISQFVMRNKEHLCVLRADRGLLVLETMFFAAEIRDPAAVLGDTLDGVEPTEREMTMAVSLLDALSESWQPEQYHDTYTKEVEALIERKQQGQEVVVGSSERPMAPVLDLMAALEQSVAKTQAAKAPSAPSKPVKAASKPKAKPAASAKRAAKSGASKAAPPSRAPRSGAAKEATGDRSHRKAS